MDLSPLLQEVLVALATPGTRIRWYANRAPRAAGRAELIGPGHAKHGQHYDGRMLSSHHMRRLVRDRHVTPADAANALPFSAGGRPYRDYVLRRPNGQG